MSPVRGSMATSAACGPSGSGSHLSIASRASRLDLEVDRRVDLEPASEDLAGAVVRDELALHVLGEVLRRAASARKVDLVGARQGRLTRHLVLLPGDQALAEHEGQHGVPAALGARGVRDRVVRGGVHRDSGEQRRLGEREVARVLVEVHAGGHADSVGAVAEVDRVQVGGEDPVLRPAALELPREGCFLELPADRPLGLDVRVLDELLCDRRAALDDLLVADVGPHGPEDAAQVDAAVLVEAPVLDRDDRLLHDRRDLVGTEDGAGLVSAQHRQDLTVGGVDVAVLLDAVVGVGRVDRRDIRGDGGHEAEGEGRQAAEPQHGEQEKEPELADAAPGPLRRGVRASSAEHDRKILPAGAARAAP